MPAMPPHISPSAAAFLTGASVGDVGVVGAGSTFWGGPHAVSATRTAARSKGDRTGFSRFTRRISRKNETVAVSHCAVRPKNEAAAGDSAFGLRQLAEIHRVHGDAGPLEPRARRGMRLVVQDGLANPQRICP
jgi:hypothetical protein